MSAKSWLGIIFAVLVILFGTYWYEDEVKGYPAPGQAPIVGEWRSTDDANFTRQFNPDGTYTDSYEGDASATSNGIWKLFTTTNPDSAFTGVLAQGTTYLKMADASTTLFFSILKETNDGLQLLYLDRGNTLSFTRVR